MESSCHKNCRPKFISFLIYIHVIPSIYIYVYKNFSNTLDKGLIKNSKKRRDGEIGESKVNEMEAMNIK